MAKTGQLRKTVHDQILKIMKRKGVRNADLARLLKCSPVSTHLMLKKPPRNMQLDSLEAICRALRCSIEITLTENGKR